MAKIKKQKGGKGMGNGFPDKYAKIPGFVSVMEDMDTLDADGLKKTLVAAEKVIEETDTAKEADEALKDAQLKAKELGASYGDANKYQKAKIKYALFCLARMGDVVAPPPMPESDK